MTNIITALGYTAQFGFAVFLLLHMALTWLVAAVLIPLFGIAAVVVVMTIIQGTARLIWTIIT